VRHLLFGQAVYVAMSIFAVLLFSIEILHLLHGGNWRYRWW
jgi:hypothetical protein